jgi:hypothetical protein
MDDDKLISEGVKEWERRAYLKIHPAWSGWLRVLPNFLIIGAQKCGTTALYDMLAKHPQILESSRKEVHFFDRNFVKGKYWYRRHFPTYWELWRRSKELKKTVVTGEATPIYLFHPLAAERVYQNLSKIKLICILRDPVDRAYSHYQHEVRFGMEPLSFEEALDREEERLSGEEEKLRKDPYYRPFRLAHYSYQARGFYLKQLQCWWKLFGKERILVLFNENLRKNYLTVLNQVFKFIGVDQVGQWEKQSSNEAKYDIMPSYLKKRLAALYQPANDLLSRELGEPVPWDYSLVL